MDARYSPLGLKASEMEDIQRESLVSNCDHDVHLEDYLNDIKGFNVTHAVHVERCGLGTLLERLNDVEDVLKRHCSQSSRMKGIRHLINHHPTMPIYSEVDHNHFLSSPQWLRGLSLLEKHHLSFELHILPGQMMEAVEAVRQNPGVQFILNHCGLPYERDEHTMRVWREGVMALAQHQNVFCKVSGLFSTNPQWTDKAVAEIVNPLLEIFGVDR
eukprot:Em0034g1a